MFSLSRRSWIKDTQCRCPFIFRSCYFILVIPLSLFPPRRPHLVIPSSSSPSCYFLLVIPILLFPPRHPHLVIPFSSSSSCYCLLVIPPRYPFLLFLPCFLSSLLLSCYLSLEICACLACMNRLTLQYYPDFTFCNLCLISS